MTTKQFISFVGGLCLTGLVYALMMFIVMMATFSFAGETLNEKENREAFFFFTSSFIVVSTIFIIYRRFKTNRKFSGIGICIPLTFALYIFFATGQIYFDNLSYRQNFDQTMWVNSETKPFNMAKTITKDKILIGQTKQQIIDKLGATKDAFKNDEIDYLKYWTDKGTWELRIHFVNNKVTEAYLYEEGLAL